MGFVSLCCTSQLYWKNIKAADAITLKLGSAWAKQTLLMAFTDICWQQRNAEVEDSLGPFQLQWELALSKRSLLTLCTGIPLCVSLPCYSLLCFMSPDPLLPASEVCVPGLVPAMALAPPPPGAAAAQSLWPQRDHSNSAYPSWLALGGIQLHADLEGCSRLSKDISFLLFCHWLLTLSWVDVISNYLKSRNTVRQKVSASFQKFLQHILKAHPEESTDPTCLSHL